MGLVSPGIDDLILNVLHPFTFISLSRNKPLRHCILVNELNRLYQCGYRPRLRLPRYHYAPNLKRIRIKKRIATHQIFVNFKVAFTNMKRIGLFGCNV